MRFKLLGNTWAIKMHPGRIPDEDAPGKTLMGTCDYDTLTIEVADCLPPDLIRHTIMHEVMHAVLHHLGRTAMCEDEDIVDSLGGAMAQILATASETMLVRLTGAVSIRGLQPHLSDPTSEIRQQPIPYDLR